MVIASLRCRGAPLVAVLIMNEYGFSSEDEFSSQDSSLQLVQKLECSLLRLSTGQIFHPVIE